MAAYGLRPVVEIQFSDYIYPGYDQICSEAARLRYRSAGNLPRPNHPHPVGAAYMAAKPIPKVQRPYLPILRALNRHSVQPI